MRSKKIPQYFFFTLMSMALMSCGKQKYQTQTAQKNHNYGPAATGDTPWACKDPQGYLQCISPLTWEDMDLTITTPPGWHPVELKKKRKAIYGLLETCYQKFCEPLLQSPRPPQ